MSVPRGFGDSGLGACGRATRLIRASGSKTGARFLLGFAAPFFDPVRTLKPAAYLVARRWCQTVNRDSALRADDLEIHSIPTLTHGRVMVRQARAAAARGVIAGFHGYGESCATQLERLKALPGADAWTLLSIQALHRFYERRTEKVVACWMTSEDREDAIADNLAFVNAALDHAPQSAGGPLVFAGFSQGVAMAFRAACRGSRAAAAVIAVGGDVPPELLQDPAVHFPRVLLVRGARDEWYSAAKFEHDVAALAAREVEVQTLTADCGHEWTAEVAETAGRFLAVSR
jgi:predicted esterase